jgi:hypothetical protein
MNEDQDVAELEKSMKAQLMQVLLDMVRDMPMPYQLMGEADQREWLARLDSRCADLIYQSAAKIGAGAGEAMRAEVDSVTFKDGVKVVLKLPFASEGAHDIADAAGDHVLVSIPQYEEHVGNEGRPEAESDQRGMDFGNDD